MSVDEVLEVTAQILIRCTILGVAVLLFWWAALELFEGFVFTIHSSLFPVSREQFGIIHYVGMMTTKAAVLLLFFFPYVAIRLVIRKRKRDVM